MNIGLVAHDSKKKLMQNFCIAYRGILSKNDLFATGTTGRLIEEVTNLSVHKYLAGHLGGTQQLAAQIEHNEIDLVIFLRDPLTAKSHEPDVNTCHVLQKQGLPARLIFNQMGPDMAKRRNRSRLQEMARHAFHAEYLGSLPDMHKKCAMPSDFLTRGKEILPICRNILMPAKETE